MLDRAACVTLINNEMPSNESRYKQQKNQARDIWHMLVGDIDLQDRLLTNTHIQFTLPLGSSYSADSIHGTLPHAYAICGIDGSQIYPDRHEGFAEYLINIGTAHFIYSDHSSAELTNKPYLFSGYDKGIHVTPEVVNGQRTEYELRHAVEAARHASSPHIMFDGALIFWHLQPAAMQARFLQAYLDQLYILYQENRVYSGYISASHGSEIVNLLEKAAEHLGIAAVFDHLVDTDIMEFFLEFGQYTQIFRPIFPLRDLYMPPLRPCFIYLHVGSEIARLELPAYLADSPQMLNTIVSLVLDQVEKGRGYPVVLSEAHEQAVIKSADRDFFYTMLQMHHQQDEMISLKLSKKRVVAV